MLPDRVSNPGPLTYESGALPIALRGQANFTKFGRNIKHDRRRAEINNSCSICIFGGIIPLCNFPFRNCVHSITLIPFEIIS